MFSTDSLKDFLEEYYQKYNNTNYIETDPIQIPHLFSQKENIEIAGFLAATLAWGNRTAIIKSAHKLIALLENNPYEFLMSASKDDIDKLNSFVYRTFNITDLRFFLRSLQNIYQHKGGLEKIFTDGYQIDNTIYSGLANFRKIFFEVDYETRSEKHVANVLKNSSCKRLNMFLRWMVRNDNAGVDFGIWKNIPTSELKIPLDLHSGNVARNLGLLTRTQNDWKAVVELTRKLHSFDPNDPVKYDFALFGYGAFNGKDL